MPRHLAVRAGSALSIVVGGLLAVRPFEGLIGLVYVIGIYAILHGLTLIAASLALRVHTAPRPLHDLTDAAQPPPGPDGIPAARPAHDR